MTLPDTDDLLLFGSIAAVALGALLVTLSLADDPIAAAGVALVVFGLPTAVITLLAAGETE